MKRIKIRLLLISLIALGLVAASAVPVLAMSERNQDNATATTANAPDQAGKAKALAQRVRQHMIRGQVASVSADTITLKDGKKIKVTGETKYRIPPKKDASLADVKVGSHIIAHVTKENDQVAAKLVIVMPEHPQAARHAGKVMAYTKGSSITIQGKDGKSTTFTINADTKLVKPKGIEDIKVGDVVTIVTKANSNVATAIFLHVVRVIRGTVTAVGTDSITVKPDNADAVTVPFDANTIFAIKGSPALTVGKKVVIVAKRSADGALVARVVSSGVKLPAHLAAKAKQLHAKPSIHKLTPKSQAGQPK
ncbi:MAG: hypothetical protein HYX87_05780 [Chloroflexi bacterium]|nr:hypothetical protein [Chloroflexota bacterium]